MQDCIKKTKEEHLECLKRSDEDFYLDQQYFSKKCREEMVRRNDDNMLVKNIFFREDGVVESAYVDETFANWDSLNLFLKHHTIDEVESFNSDTRYPSEEL